MPKGLAIHVKNGLRHGVVSHDSPPLRNTLEQVDRPVIHLHKLFEKIIQVKSDLLSLEWYYGFNSVFFSLL